MGAVTNPLTEAAQMGAKELDDTRARLMRIREACDYGIGKIEAGETPDGLTGVVDDFEREALAVQRSLSVVRSLRGVFGEEFRREVTRILAVRLGRSFKGAK